MVEVSIVVPTYNERDNMGVLLGRIHQSMENFENLENLKYEVIIVDDNSPDGTAQVAQQLSNIYPVKTIIRKNEKGLATAVVEGFKQAKGDIFVVMDADLQHPPETIIPLLIETLNGTDIAIGSRYVERDGKGFGDFSSGRKIISKGANNLAKILFPKLFAVNDIQSGFFALKKDVIKDIDLNPIGYKILLEILIAGNYKNVKEVPFVFGKRENGESKLGGKIIFDYLRHLTALFWKGKDIKRIVKFMITGIMGIVFSVALLWFLTEKSGIFYLVSGVISKEAGTLLSFGLSELWVFKDRIKITLKGSFKRCVQFNINRIASMSITIIVMAILTQYFGIYYIISNFIGILVAFPLNYALSNSWVWKSQSGEQHVL